MKNKYILEKLKSKGTYSTQSGQEYTNEFSENEFDYKNQDENEIVPNYFLKLEILKNYSDFIITVKNSNVKSQLDTFIYIVQSLIYNYFRNYENIFNLPPLLFIQEEDESVDIEWNFKNYRFGFTFEKEEKLSNWYYVSNLNDENLITSGSLIGKENIENVIFRAINILLSYV